jgi:hypothetical protein
LITLTITISISTTKTSPTMQASIVVGDILDIGTRQYDVKKNQASNGGGSAGLCPTEMKLGIPGAFDVPNVSDVSLRL